ncbi:MAG: UPF0175 family protein [Candidatus Hydrogenedentes bacterium]|nr:UPF0175 family protein [Candidatus Hydrogenedentota bacterium]
MAVHITLDFPLDLEERLHQEMPDVNADAREVYVLELFRRGTLTHYELSQLLGLDRFETDALLKRRGIFEGSPSWEDVEADRVTLDHLFGKTT